MLYPQIKTFGSAKREFYNISAGVIFEGVDKAAFSNLAFTIGVRSAFKQLVVSDENDYVFDDHTVEKLGYMKVRMVLRFVCSSDECRDNVLTNLISIDLSRLNEVLNRKLRKDYGMTSLPMSSMFCKSKRQFISIIP